MNGAASPAALPAVLHHAALPHRGGAVRVARLLLREQRKAGLDARLSFELDETDPEELGGHPDPEDARVPRIGPVAPAELGRAWAALPRIAALHLHTSTDWPGLLSGLLPHATGRRLLLTLHDAAPLTGGCAYPLDCPHFPACVDPCPRDFPDARARQAETAGLLRSLAPILASPSRWLARLARQALPELPARVIPNGVPWPELSALASPTHVRAQARATLGIAPQVPVALFAAHGGARAAYKSGPRWPEYWRAVREQLPQAQAFAVGGDEALTRDGLTVWPYVDRAKLALLMRAADALLYPTLADNHPLVLLEAAALELPVVSFAVGGVPEIVTPGGTGLLAAPGDERAFCQAACSLLSDAALCRRLGRAARDRGGRRFNVARMAADYAALLEG
ncbi:MAG: glycosyltransferase [Desulfovibrio sp.]